MEKKKIKMNEKQISRPTSHFKLIDLKPIKNFKLFFTKPEFQIHVLTFRGSAGTRTCSQLVRAFIVYDEWWSAGGMSRGQLVQRVAVSWSNAWRSAGLMSGSQLVQCVAVSWYKVWWSAGTTSGSQLVQGVTVSWFNEWRSADTMCGSQLVQGVAVSWYNKGG